MKKRAIAVWVLFAGGVAMADAPGDVVRESGVTGGLVVDVGNDPEFTAGLFLGERFLVHGLYTEEVAAARRAIAAKGVYGKVSIDRYDGKTLPYGDNLVNLLVVSNAKASVPGKEILRVLAPRGVALVGGKKFVKPVPEDIDDWTHYLHGPDNNAVAKDYKIAPPYHTQWEGGPRWQRSHDILASLSALVSSEGKLFYIHDEGNRTTIAMPADWRLVARDAFNGIIQWNRAIPKWESHFKGFRTGPVDLSRRLVAVAGKVYVTLGYGEPVSVLDADSGKTLMEYQGTEGAHEILVDGGTVYVTVIRETEAQLKQQAEASRARLAGRVAGNRNVPLNKNGKPARRRMQKEGTDSAVPEKSVMAVDAGSGKILWKKTGADADRVCLNSLTAGNGNVFYQNGGTLFCLNGKTGAVNWKAERPTVTPHKDYSSPTIVLYNDVLLAADSDPSLKKEKKKKAPKGTPHVTGTLIAYSVKDGKKLWSCPTAETFHSPFEVFVIDSLVWTGGVDSQQDPGLTEGRDPKTGKVVIKRSSDADLFTIVGHASCYRNKATERFILQNRAGIDFIDVKNDKAYTHHFTRGTCQYGVLPANGYTYQPPHACNCYIYAKLSGYVAMAGKRYTIPATPDNILEKGPAYTQVSSFQSQVSPADWPTYRYDTDRRSAIKGSVPVKARQAWARQLKGTLTPPVAAGKLLYVANISSHTLHALDIDSGKQKWNYIPGGVIDSPPTIYNGLAVFGCGDGWVYCLDARTGTLAWRFRAAPNNQRIVSYGELKSIWPVPGNVLVLDGAAYFVAGRTSYMDGGMFLYKLDLKTGRRLAVQRIYDRDPRTDLEKKDVPDVRNPEGGLPDVLSSDGKSIFMRHRRFDLDLKEQPQDVPHLFSSVGFLDGDWWHRSFWQLGTSVISGFGGWGKTGNGTISGQILSFDDDTVYGYGHKIYGNNIYHGTAKSQGHYRLFSMPKSNLDVSKVMMTKEIPQGKRREINEIKKKGFELDWEGRTKILTRAMVLAGDKLVIAGPPDALYGEPLEPELFDQERILKKFEERSDAVSGKREGILLVVSAKDGKTLSEQQLPSPPVFNGMIAAQGRLFITDTKGRIVCFR